MTLDMTWEFTNADVPTEPGVAGSIRLARVGDVLETNVRYPREGILRVRLDTPAACTEANRLLMNRSSGWRLRRPGRKGL